MKINKIYFLFCSAFFIFLTITACKTTPPAEVTPTPAPVEKPADVPVKTPVAKPVDDALTSLRDRMESVRNEGLKYKLDSYKEKEWSVAEQTRSAGLAAYGVDYDQAEKKFSEAIMQYEAIRRDSFDSIVPELEAAIIRAREEAIAAGAPEYYPDQFALADEAVEEALAIRVTDDLSGAYDAGQKALMRYQTLVRGMQAVSLKQKIDANGFEQYAPDEAALAIAKYDEAVQAYGVADAAALEAATECVIHAENVLNAGYKVWSADMIVKADEIRTLCDSIKAERSMKDAYGAANLLYVTGQDYGRAGNWEQAYMSYSDSAIAFTNVFQEVTLKRNMADVAIAAAKDKQLSSTELATKADVLAPLPENAEGFSDEAIIIDSTISGEEAK